MKALDLKPVFKEKIWGGKRLAEMYGLDAGRPIGEAWLVYDDNRVASGRYQGKTLKEALQELGEGFLGASLVEKYGYSFPLILKLIDAAEWLSIQVHPDDRYARTKEAKSGFLGKDEAWLVLEAEPGARIVYGVAEEVSARDFAEALRLGEIESLLNYVEVRPGDFVYLPAGTIHALGPGLLVLEVSQRSDLTYRLYDYGRNRPLHLSKGLEVARLKPGAADVRRTTGEFSYTFANFTVGSGVCNGREAACALVNMQGAPWSLIKSASTEGEAEVAGFFAIPRV